MMDVTREYIEEECRNVQPGGVACRKTHSTHVIVSLSDDSGRRGYKDPRSFRPRHKVPSSPRRSGQMRDWLELGVSFHSAQARPRGPIQRRRSESRSPRNNEGC